MTALPALHLIAICNACGLDARPTRTIPLGDDPEDGQLCSTCHSAENERRIIDGEIGPRLIVNIVRELAGCRFAPASWDKRFARDMYALVTARKPLTAKQSHLVLRFGHRYRRQLGRCMVPNCEKCGS